MVIPASTLRRTTASEAAQQSRVERPRRRRVGFLPKIVFLSTTRRHRRMFQTGILEVRDFC
jgi:hypothetical protein